MLLWVLFSKRSQMTSKCGNNKKVALEAQLSVSLLFLPHLFISCVCDLDRPTATQNLFDVFDKEEKTLNDGAIY